MYYVLYIDVLFLQNLLLDYLLLTVTARLLKLSPGRIRRLLAAGLGSLLLCLVYALWPGARFRFSCCSTGPLPSS